jgi:hypothetical protein
VGLENSVKRLVRTGEQSCDSEPEPTQWEGNAYDRQTHITKGY